ncbi:flagellar MS-ring protein [Salinisphaera dokdonensis CL-ES53]|uniref:Flagellar M-ring protein n=1 Tax=Salinisphaera dokdonensis CL-ES53 TaxID=1304272 RepID=A0ABV2AY88_9GAMM
MASAETPVAATESKPGLLDQLRANPRIPLIVGIAAAITLLVGMALWSVGPSYGVLFSNLSDRDGGEIIAELEQMQVPYKFAANGQTILVPTDMIDRTRLSLAGEGLPNGGGVGFELMDNQSFGISQFAEHVNYKRALEGELARSIETIAAVGSARVHLAIPESSVFVREREKPTASIVLDLYRGRALGDGQVTAIVNLVASSVTNLPTESVTVVDASGKLLSDNNTKAQASTDTQLAYVTRVEDSYRQSIQSILSPVVGSDNIRAQVVADVDFSTGEQTQEIYTPNGDPDNAAIRSEQSNSTRNNGGAMIGGVPGALSNQPSPDMASPINSPQQQGGGAGESNLNMNGRAGLAFGGNDPKGSSVTSSTVNYELNRTIRHTRDQAGRLQRLSAAVVIGYPMQPNAEGELQPMPLSQERMDQIKSLVREAIGFSAARGDSLEVINMPFNAKPDVVTQPSAPWWQDRQLLAMAQNALKYLLLAIVAWFVWRKFIKPMLAQIPNMAPVRLADARNGDIAGDLGVDDPQGQDLSANLNAGRTLRRQQDALLTTTRDAAKNDPRLVAAIVKSWMHANG